MAVKSPPRVVELIRVSSVGQAERDTPQVQRRALDALQKSRPGRLVECIDYGADGLSGALPLSQRPDLRRLQVLSQRQAFDEIRVYALDRLTRAEDLRERAEVWGFAYDASALLVDCRGTVIDPRTRLGELQFVMQSGADADERLKIVRRTMDGRLRALAEGRLSQGSPPYGRAYDRQAKRWALHEPEAGTYREIIARVIAGASTRRLCADLDARGIAPPRGARWAPTTIKKLVHSATAVGRYRVAGVLQKLPPVCTEEEWRAATAALKRGRTKGGRAPTIPAMLRGLVRCAHCGRRMRVHSDGKGAGVFYACPKSQDVPRGEAPCPRRVRHRVAGVDQAAREMVAAAVSSPRRIAASAAAATKGGEAGQMREAIEQARARIATAEAREAKVLRLLDVLSEDVARARLATIRRDRAAAEAALAEAEGQLTAIAAAPGPEQARQLAASIAGRIRDASPEEWRALLLELVPPREPYGLVLSADRELSGRAVLPGVVAPTSARCAHDALAVVVRLGTRLGVA